VSGVIDEKIAERRRAIREGRRRSRLRRTVTVALLLVLLAGLVALERSALVGLEEIRVSGAERLDEEAIRAASELELGYVHAAPAAGARGGAGGPPARGP
jgi:cell division septal protein FtsQ